MKKNEAGIFAILVIFTLLQIGSVLAKGKNTGSDTDSWVAPPTAKNIQNPITSDAKVKAEGKKIFEQQCATCHGNGGKGDGPAGKYLGKKLPDFTKALFSQQTDGEIFWKLTNGNAPMPAFKEILSEEKRWQVINYLRTFASH
ncbi:MAG: c-type cytochrome [Calditrichaeota bacterium]|nr:c-type cytochrome [Calditrichota bacterium]MCB0266691.1 c-type cytochrome [Calditrichota bacterium]MCB9067263.1 c-type cytochrome [Calditrichia bacterium]